MSKMMILGVKGETGLWLIDFDAGSVTAMDGKREDYITTEGASASHDQRGSADLTVAFDTKDSAFSGHVFRSAELAVAFETRDAAFSGHVFRSAELAVAFETKDAAFSGHVFKASEAA